MDGLPGQERLTSPDMVLARVLKDAQRSMGGVAPAELEQYVQVAVSNLWTEQTRVTSFIPLLALREVREMLERQATGVAV
ncbi:MAG: hypothetical protein H0U10_17525 [Chloroflexia bacterium]|nr:hypothetical protein [Chloroflexia bacterium]